MSDPKILHFAHYRDSVKLHILRKAHALTRRRLAISLWTLRAAARDLKGRTTRVPVWRDVVEALRVVRGMK